jgi:BirA family biotin operon repressor/biotin-[acetyl-CoA-carboxylase] ligase
LKDLTSRLEAPVELDAIRDEPTGSVDFYREWFYREAVGSTMDVTRELAERGAPEATVVIAGEQTAGRGRHGRGWASPPGGAWFSLVLRPDIESSQAGCVSLLLGAALAGALRARYDLPVCAKWPNDLWLWNRKLGGVLIELSAVGGRLGWLIAGVGINVNNSLPEGARVPPISLAEALGRPVNINGLYAVVLGEIARSYREFSQRGFEPVRRRWWEFSLLQPGDAVTVERGDERYVARVRGLSDIGHLVVEDGDGRIEELAAADVTLCLSKHLRG